MTTDILVIDDDAELNSLLKEYLAKFGMRVFSATEPEQGLKLLKKQKPAAVILDVMLPGMDGFQVCKRIRQESDTPILMLTARGEIPDRVLGLEIGADDYLTKPFEPRELVARIQTVLRRTRPVGGKKGVFKSGDLALDLASRTVTLKGRDLEVTTTEFEILRLFLENPGTTLTREQILERIRGIEYEAFNLSVDLVVSRLRQKLGDTAKSQKHIKTIWGTGYLFLGKVARHDA
jgi:DNA-binding response OmpR family regulator